MNCEYGISKFFTKSRLTGAARGKEVINLDCHKVFQSKAKVESSTLNLMFIDINVCVCVYMTASIRI